MGKLINQIKRQEMLTGPEILAGFILDRATNKNGIVRLTYYSFPFWVEYVQEDGLRLDCYYLHQENSFPLLALMKKKPDYNSVLAVAPSILEWLDATYANCCPPEPKKARRRTPASQQQRSQSLAGPLGNNSR